MENTIGDVPIQWFRDEEHIGYDADGRKILKRARVDHLDHLLQMVDDPTYWRKVFDEREDKEISISREQVRPARRRSLARPPLRVHVLRAGADRLRTSSRLLGRLPSLPRRSSS